MLGHAVGFLLVPVIHRADGELGLYSTFSPGTPHGNCCVSLGRSRKNASSRRPQDRHRNGRWHLRAACFRFFCQPSHHPSSPRRALPKNFGRKSRTARRTLKRLRSPRMAWACSPTCRSPLRTTAMFRKISCIAPARLPAPEQLRSLDRELRQELSVQRNSRQTTTSRRILANHDGSKEQCYQYAIPSHRICPP